MLKVKGLSIILGVVLIFASSCLAQEIVYDNFGPNHDGWDYNYQTGWTVSGINADPQYGVEQAMAFESNINGYVTDIWVGFFYVPSSSMPDTVFMRLTAFNGGPPQPEDVMEEWTLTEFESWTSWSPPIHLEANGTSRLEEGQLYWLWASGGETTWCGWCINVDPNVLCLHTIRRENEDWLSISSESASAFRVDAEPVTDIASSDEALPSDMMLSQNYPNPFNMSTNIEYALTEHSHVRLSIYDILGREIDVLVNESQTAGNYRVCWRADNDIASGVYYYRLQTDEATISKRMVLTK